MQTTITGLIKLSRPVNLVLTFLTILTSALISMRIMLPGKIALACLSGIFIAAAANAINDYYDRDIDRINKPSRPIPAGLIPVSSALYFAIALFTLSLLCSFAINALAFFMSLGAIILSWIYSAWLKGTVLAGNFAVSLLTAIAFLFGGATVGHVQNSYIPAGFAFLMHFGREIVKDMEDMRGDRQFHAFTLPVVYGIKPAQRFTTAIFCLLFLTTLAPYLYEVYGVWYLLIVMLGVNPVLLYALYSMWRNPATRNLHRLSELLKMDMLVGLIAIYAGRW